jgi:hypothetical protein
MHEHELTELSTDTRHPETSVGRAQPEWAARATSDRATEWSSDRALDPGDTHDKGELSLCVGEAA